MNVATYQSIINNTMRWLDLPNIRVEVSINESIDRGRGWFHGKRMELPKWLEDCDASYRIYYVIHELTHCLIGYKHDKEFKRIEDILLSLWDIEIERKRVYPKKLYHNGVEVFNIPSNINMLNTQKERYGT